MALVTEALGSVVPKLALLLKEYKLQTGVRKKIESLSRDLQSMHAAVRRVAEVPPEQLDDEVSLWARDVRELSYDIEDILDTFLVRVDSRKARDDPHMFKRAAKAMGKLFSKSKARHQIDGVIRIINEQADAVAERHRRYRAEDIVVSKPTAPRTVDPRLEAMYTQVTQLVAIEKPIEDLVSKLSPLGDDQMKTVSVVGAGGLGKTTLAKAVYDKLRVNFECTAFVPVGRYPDLKKVFRDILIGLDKNIYMDPKFIGLDERQLIDELREYLQDKRYFIVIDDIWTTDTWKIIAYALVQNNNNGSRVITTTRHSDVADQAGDVYKLEPLPPDQSEKLFYTRIFDAIGSCPSNQLKEASDKILNKCHGVPLAIITMASLLVAKTSGEWIEVCQTIIFHDKKNRQVSDIEWILSLSYYDLPPHLKTCLLYLSAFPEDHVIDKDALIWRWVAEGFVHKEPGTNRLYEVGEGYFNELINRSMIQAVVESEENAVVYGCRIHDMVLDLLRAKSQEENFVTIFSGYNENTSSPCRVRRVAHHNRTVEQTQVDMGHVRTFIAVDCRSHMLSFLNFQLLRVLALEGCSNNRDCHVICLEHIENLLHLRYLGLSRTSVCELPEGLGALKFLETLDLRSTRIKELPSSTGLLTQLTCLHAWDARMPNGIGKNLTSLEQLQIRCVQGMREFVTDLGYLRELRVLIADVVMTEGGFMQSDLVESLSKLHKIQHLELFCAIETLDEAIWNAAVLPQPLRHLSVNGTKFSVLPSCINPSDLPNLTRLNLDVLRMDEQSLMILGGLPAPSHDFVDGVHGNNNCVCR